MPAKLKQVDEYIFTKIGFNYRVLVGRNNKWLRRSYNTLEEARKARDAFLIQFIKSV
jgi:hypothetical protein